MHPTKLMMREEAPLGGGGVSPVFSGAGAGLMFTDPGGGVSPDGAGDGVVSFVPEGEGGVAFVWLE